MYRCFNLVLMVTSFCNLRCDYCYVDKNRPRRMAPAQAITAIDRALASVNSGGDLELGFFGGEPLLAAEMVADLIDYGREQARKKRVVLRPSLTTNATVTSDPAWQVMTRDDLDLAISCDGVPAVHDRHRVSADGQGSAAVVLRSIEQLLAAGKTLQVVMVVRPDSLSQLVTGMELLQKYGVRRFNLTLDLWTLWQADDTLKLEHAIAAVADFWRGGLPDISVNWFDEKLMLLLQTPGPKTARCCFGDGQIAVAPSGNLYPCERLIGTDNGRSDYVIGHIDSGNDFVRQYVPPDCFRGACRQCQILPFCNAYCRCSNYLRTGDATLPDQLLCMLNQICLREIVRVLEIQPEQPEQTKRRMFYES